MHIAVSRVAIFLPQSLKYEFADLFVARRSICSARLQPSGGAPVGFGFTAFGSASRLSCVT
jgi:hypothetical protein